LNTSYPELEEYARLERVRIMNINEMLRDIREASLQDRLVIFIGAGVSRNSGFKLWQEIVKEMDANISYSSSDRCEKYTSDELLKIPQFVYDQDQDHSQYFNMLEAEYGKKIDEPNIIIDTLLQLKPKHIITTNFDNLIEFSLDKSDLVDAPIDGKLDRYTRIYKDADMINAKRSRLFIKMHGDCVNKDQLVLKERDYLQYSSSHSFIETFIKTLFINHIFLFVGYGIGDYNLKLIMSWVDGIADKYKGEVERTQHFLINARDSTINKFDKEFLKASNINVLEYNDLPECFRNKPVDDMNINEGKNLQRCCLYLTEFKPTEYETSQIIEKLSVYENFSFICFEDILSCLDIDYSYFYTKIHDTLYIENIEHTPRVSAIDSILHILSDGDDESKNLIKAIFIKCGIKCIIRRNDRLEVIHEFDITDFHKSIGDYVLDNNIQMLRKFLEPESKTNKLNRAYIMAYIHDNECIGLFQNLYYGYKKAKNYNMQLVLGINLLHTEGKFISYPLFKALPDSFLKPIKTLSSYYSMYDNLYAYANRECAKIITKYSKNNPSMSSESFQNREFNTFRTQLFDVIKFFIYNSICVDASLKGRSLYGNYHNIISLYLGTIIKLTSPYVRQKLIASKKRDKYEEYSLELMDFYLLINLVDDKDIRYLLKENNVSLLKVADNQSSKEYLLSTFQHILEEFSFSQQNSSNFYSYSIVLKSKLLNCAILLQYFTYSEDEIIFVANIAKMAVTAFIPLFKEQHFVVYRDFINEIQQLLFYIKRQNDNTDLFEPISEILSIIVSEIQNNTHEANSVFLNCVLADTNLVINLASLIKNKCFLSSDTITNILRITAYNENRFLLLASIYSISCVEGKEGIRLYIKQNIQNLQPNDIYFLVLSDTVNFTMVEDRLLELCEKAKAKADAYDVGDINKPFYVVARLYELSKVSDLVKFSKYAIYNYFFSFVCFPESFDYANFDIHWYSWLSLARYSSQITEDRKVLLKPLFRDEMNNIPDEKFKAIYYSLFFDSQKEWDTIR
jgi:hypothetical protein